MYLKKSGGFHENSVEMWREYHTPKRFSLQYLLHALKKGYASKIFARRILQFSGPIRSALELGCGSASTLARLHDLTGASCFGVDSCAEVIQSAREQYKYLSLEVGDIFHLRYKQKSFDVVFSLGLFEHFSLQEQKQLLQIHQNLARKAIIFMTPADSVLMNSIVYLNKNLLKKTGNWADEEVFSQEVLKRKFPYYTFQAFKDPVFGNMLFWFGCKV